MFVRNGERLGSVIREPSRAGTDDDSPPPVVGMGVASAASERQSTRAELVGEAESLGLATYGTKADLQARIDDARGEVVNGGDD